MEFPLVDVNQAANTKERILLNAVRMFAEKGYAAVSIRNIAEAASISKATFYDHFESKEALYDVILNTIKTTYLDFYNRVDQDIEQVTCFADVLECLFSELKEVYHMFIYYGVSLIATEQYRDEKARHAFNDVYMKIGIEYGKKVFDGCVQRGWVKPFDTGAYATFFMNNVFTGSLVRTQEGLGYTAMYDATGMFVALQKFMMDAVEIIE